LRRVGVIINPISGARARAAAGAERVERARRAMRDHHIDGEIATTQAKGHAAELSRGFRARGFDAVVGWGGDGTINEAAGPLIGSAMALGVIPSGSGDGFARSLGLPFDVGAALAAASTGPLTDVDVGYLGGRHFLNIAGVGFDAAIAASFNASTRRGGFGYVTRTLRMVWGYQCGRYDTCFDGETHTGDYLIVVIANGREYGNGLVIAPDANPRDGLLDAVVVNAGAPWRQLWRARRLLVGRSNEIAGVWRGRLTAGSISAPRLQCHVDGEEFETSSTLDVRVAPGALQVCGLK
jgi:YegS/Rv2252/BmrU family lipid kinase